MFSRVEPNTFKQIALEHCDAGQHGNGERLCASGGSRLGFAYKGHPHPQVTVLTWESVTYVSAARRLPDKLTSLCNHKCTKRLLLGFKIPIWLNCKLRLASMKPLAVIKVGEMANKQAGGAHASRKQQQARERLGQTSQNLIGSRVGAGVSSKMREGAGGWASVAAYPAQKAMPVCIAMLGCRQAGSSHQPVCKLLTSLSVACLLTSSIQLYMIVALLT